MCSERVAYKLSSVCARCPSSLGSNCVLGQSVSLYRDKTFRPRVNQCYFVNSREFRGRISSVLCGIHLWQWVVRTTILMEGCAGFSSFYGRYIWSNTHLLPYRRTRSDCVLDILGKWQTNIKSVVLPCWKFCFFYILQQLRLFLFDSLPQRVVKILCNCSKWNVYNW